AGKLLLVPFASATLFSRAPAGLKNICENLDHGIDPNSTVVVRRYRAMNTYVQAMLPLAWTHAHTRPKVTLKTTETINNSARTKRNGEFPSAATAPRIKTKNQKPPRQPMRAPMYHNVGKLAGVGVAGVGYAKTMITVVTT